MGKKSDKRYFNEDLSKDPGTQEMLKSKSSQSNKDSKDENKAAGAITMDLSGQNFNTFRKDSWKVKRHMKKIQQVEKFKNSDENQGQIQNGDQRNDPFPGEAPIPKEKLDKYKKGKKISSVGIKTKFHKRQFERKEKQHSYAAKAAARSELMLQEEAGFIEADDGEHTSQYRQKDIAGEVDLMSSHKYFELNLDRFGPYRMNYTKNGRQLLIGGNKGHVAAFDWQTKKLMCEMNVMERCYDVKWLHIETMFAVAQKQWTYIYDNQGIELHCLKALDSVLRMEFLPYHFLLATASAKSYLSWLDVSVGQKVAGFPTGLGRLDVMCQNPSNAIIILGHTGGTVSLWSPNTKQPVAKLLCHGSGTRAVAVDKSGTYLATSGVDRKIKIWDIRQYKELYSYKISAGANHLDFSGRGLLAAGIGNIVEVYKDPCKVAVTEPYLSHRLPGTVQNAQFCPYEDMLGVGHGNGFSSLLIPGAGEPNFDALESNPYQSKKQRQEREVKMLLEKIQPDMINVDTNMLGKVDTVSLQERLDDKAKTIYLKPEKIDFEPKYKKKGKSKTGRVEKRKKGVKEKHVRDQVKAFIQNKEKEKIEKKKKTENTPSSEPYSVFNRFKKVDA